jgi:hypothetical protein
MHDRGQGAALHVVLREAGLRFNLAISTHESSQARGQHTISVCRERMNT